MEISLAQKVIVVTGATGGLGTTVVRVLQDAGGTVISLDRGNSLQTESHPTNVLDEEDVRRAFSQITGRYQRIHGLVHLVGGIYPWSKMSEIDLSTWQQTIELNLTSAFLCSREAIRILHRSGSIVHVGAQAGVRGGAQAGPYGAAKSAVINLTQTLADEGRTAGFRANAVVPSIIDTPANRKAMPEADFSAWVTPQEIANVICFLLSDAASGVTGAILPVPGRA